MAYKIVEQKRFFRKTGNFIVKYRNENNFFSCWRKVRNKNCQVMIFSNRHRAQAYINFRNNPVFLCKN